MKKIQVIIPIYKPDHKLIELLKKIKEQSIEDIPLLIIDSGSNDEYKSEIKKHELFSKENRC